MSRRIKMDGKHGDYVTAREVADIFKLIFLTKIVRIIYQIT